MKTAEEILDEYLQDYPWQYWSKENAIKAMEAYAAQQKSPSSATAEEYLKTHSSAGEDMVISDRLRRRVKQFLNGFAAEQVAEATKELLKQRDELREALAEAVRTIRIWHGFMEADPTEAKAWKYYQGSPEMKKINAAIKSTER